MYARLYVALVALVYGVDRVDDRHPLAENAGHGALDLVETLVVHE